MPNNLLTNEKCINSALCALTLFVQSVRRKYWPYMENHAVRAIFVGSYVFWVAERGKLYRKMGLPNLYLVNFVIFLFSHKIVWVL